MTTGVVWLVGAGPGDPDLMTLRAHRLLAEADVVVHDRLVPDGVIEALPARVHRIDVGKQPYHHKVTQAEINRLLVDHALTGRTVVRLKGGDPYLLGRGGEEAQACRDAGVEVHVVPGVSSAFAGPAAAGIPVTQRGVAPGVLVLSGHEETDPAMLAAWPYTIVILMGMFRLPTIVADLLAAGKDPDTPAAIVHRAWTPAQREVRAPLHALARAATEAGLANPSVIVIGDVAAGY